MSRLDPEAVHVRVLDVLLRAAGPGASLKAGILHRTAQRIAAEILRARTSSTDPVHFGTLAVVHAVNDAGDPLSAEAILALGRYVLRGRVLPIQRLHQVLDEARTVFLARCPCRASGRVDDRVHRRGAEDAERLGDGVHRGGAEDAEDSRDGVHRRGAEDTEDGGETPSPALRSRRLGGDPLPGPLEAAGLLESILAAAADADVRRRTSPRLLEAIDRTAGARRRGTAGGTLDDLLAAVWPQWEILLEHPAYDTCWLEGLAKNRKVWAVAKPLAHAWVDALYRARGVIFTHMEAVGLPYAVCSCPGPEADRGCMLTNWHYFSGNDEILLPNEGEAFGRRRDPQGRVLPCRKHPERGGKGCLGCGCDHAAEEKRGR